MEFMHYYKRRESRELVDLFKALKRTKNGIFVSKQLKRDSINDRSIKAAEHRELSLRNSILDRARFLFYAEGDTDLTIIGFDTSQLILIRDNGELFSVHEITVHQDQNEMVTVSKLS